MTRGEALPQGQVPKAGQHYTPFAKMPAQQAIQQHSPFLKSGASTATAPSASAEWPRRVYHQDVLDGRVCDSAEQFVEWEAQGWSKFPFPAPPPEVPQSASASAAAGMDKMMEMFDRAHARATEEIDTLRGEVQALQAENIELKIKIAQYEVKLDQPKAEAPKPIAPKFPKDHKE